MMNNTSETPRESWFMRIWNLISNANPNIHEVGEQRQARLVAGISFILVLVGIFGTLATWFSPDTPDKLGTAYALMSFLGLVLIAYIFSRTRRFIIGAILLIISIAAFGYGRAFIIRVDQAGIILVSLPTALIIGLAVFNRRDNIILTAALTFLPILLSVFLPQFFPWTVIANTSGAVLAMGVIAILVSITRERIEHDRLEESQRANRELQELSASLEQQVQVRTRDIALASELGRRISLVRDMDTLLSDSVTLIQEHFDLYYAQVYLVDQNTRSLVLKAGSGEVGKEMIRRAHRLPMDYTSINGMAVADRRAVIVSDTSASLTFRPHELLPETRSEMAIPLISGDRVLGAFDLQSSKAGALTSENQAVFETVAHQLAIALVNVELFGQVQHSLAELEAHSRRDVRMGWQDYLDGIETRERLGYTYDRMGVAPLDEPLADTSDGCAFTAAMQISGEPVGKLQLVSDRPWSEDDQETAQAVAALVAQQIENLRLLDQAERYRRDAEDAVRRLSRQEWAEFIESAKDEELAFAYTGDQVKSIQAGSNGHADGLNFDIKVQDEAIGELGINGVQMLSSEEEEILRAVTSQLGAHLENLRLYTTSQQELAERQRAEKAVQEELVERMRTEEALRTSQADLSNALRTAHMGYWELDLATMLFTFNDDFYAMLRTTAEAEGGYHLTPEQYGKYVHPDDVHLMADETRKAIETTDPNYVSRVEHRIFFADGEPGYISVLITVLKDENGKTIKTRGVNQDITERRHAEDALRASEADLSNALRTSHMGYWECDLTTMLFTFNDDFYAMLHTTAEAEGGYHLTPQQYGKFVHPDDAHLMVEGIQEAIETTDPNFSANLEHRCFYADGGTGYMSVLVTIVKDENGKTIKTRGVNQDITERRYVEDALRLSEQNLSRALRTARMGYWELDLATMLFTFNDDFYAMLRTTAEAEGGYHLTPEQYGKFVHPDDVHLMADETRKAIETTDPNYTAQVEHRVFFADGEPGYISVLITVVKDEDGKTIKTRGVNQDITERVKASLAMEEQRRTLQIILNNMPVAVLAKDVKTYEFVMWNQAAEELFGMKSQDVIGKTDYDFYPKEQADAFRAADIEVISDRKTVNIPEEKANNAKGETRILQTVKVPLVDENDQPVLLLVVTADITEVKMAQETIAKRAEELEKVASVSTKVSTIQTPDEMLQTVVDLTKESFDLYHTHIYLFNEADEVLVLTKGAGEIGRQMVAEGRQIALSADKSLVARAARTRLGVTVNDVRQDPDFLPHPLLPETRSEMAVPMVAGDHLLGVIDVQDEEVGRFSQEDVSILTTLAAQVAVSLQNARSFARAQRQAEREALINTISERIQATNSVENALQVAVREIGRALGAQHTAIRLGLERKNTDQS